MLEKLHELQGDAEVIFTAKAGLDGSGSHKKRHQLSDDSEDDAAIGESDSFLGVFMTPLQVSLPCTGNVPLWENPSPNSIFYTRPLKLIKVKESRDFVGSFFPQLQSELDSLRPLHEVPGIARKVKIETRVTMIDGKMVDILHGVSGAFCHYCDINQRQASSLDVLLETGVDGMPITKTVEECQKRWELIEKGEIRYQDPQRKGQCHKPLISQSGRLFAILHQELRSLDFILKIYYHLISGQKIWSESNPRVKERIADAKSEAIKHVKHHCGGLRIDSPTSSGGNTNTGPVAKRFFHPDNREAICSLISCSDEQANFSILLSQLNVCLAVSESVNSSCKVDVGVFKQHCYDTMLHMALHFPWVRISPSVHQMLDHNWELFDMLGGNPIAVWSESGLEAWNKHIRNFRSGAGCRARQSSVKNNITDIFVRMLITSAPAVAKARQNVIQKSKRQGVLYTAATKENALIKSMYI